MRKTSETFAKLAPLVRIEKANLRALSPNFLETGCKFLSMKHRVGLRLALRAAEWAKKRCTFCFWEGFIPRLAGWCLPIGSTNDPNGWGVSMTQKRGNV
jgi:hypothetical protein